MAELDTDFGGEEEINPFQGQKQKISPPNTNFIGPNYEEEQEEEEEEEDEDDDLNDNNNNNKSKVPKRIRELDDSGDELEENEKNLQRQFKRNFNDLFANKSNIDGEDCVVQEEIDSKEYNKEHGEQKMEPFNLKEERGEGYFDQFLNYHKIKNKEDDPFYIMMDEDKEKDEKLFNKKYHLSADIIKKHKRDYENFENANTEINLLNEWKSLLPLFCNNTQSITNAMQSLSEIIRKYENKNINNRPTKKRKLNDENGRDNIYNNNNKDMLDALNNNNNKKNKNKKRKKRAWEIESDEDGENDNENKNDSNNNDDTVSDRELMGIKRKFEIFSEKATMLFANGDHNIYEQTRDSLIHRIKLVEDEELFNKQKQKANKPLNNNNNNNNNNDIDDMLADFDDDDDDDKNEELNDKDMIWEYRWKHDKNKEKHGPFSCQQMFEWIQHFQARPIWYKQINETEWKCSVETDLLFSLKSYNR